MRLLGRIQDEIGILLYMIWIKRRSLSQKKESLLPGKSIWMSIPTGTVTSHWQSVSRLTLLGKPGLVMEPRVLNTAPPQPAPENNKRYSQTISSSLPTSLKTLLCWCVCNVVSALGEASRSLGSDPQPVARRRDGARKREAAQVREQRGFARVAISNL